MNNKKGPKVLFLDIETSPILGYVWGLWENNLGLDQVKQDWYILSWSAKWLGDAPSKTMYADQRNSRNIENDTKLLKKIWKLMDEADIIVTQNGKRFDKKKLYARFIMNGMLPPSPFKHIDTYEIAKKHFAFTSNKLEYMTDKLCVKYKKLKHAKYAGFSLWKECLAGNKDAWEEMETYNKHDVLSLEELYNNLYPWDNSINFNLYNNDKTLTCSCGSTELQKRGYSYTAAGKYQRYRCVMCGAWSKSPKNLFSKQKRESLLRKV